MERVAGLSTLLRHRRLIAALAIALAVTGTPQWASGSPMRHQGIAAPAACSGLANSIRGTAHADELITVVAGSLRSQSAKLSLFKREGSCFRLVAGPYAAFVGINGLSGHHREGDGTTPIGLFGISTTMYGVEPDPGVSYHYHQLVCGDWWDEDPRSTSYNRFVHVACGTTPPFAGNSEALWEKTPQYGYFASISYNVHPVVDGRGSAIFLHVSKGDPTTGCISIARGNLVKVLRMLAPSLQPLIDITTAPLLKG